jgi:hypothetical protein
MQKENILLQVMMMLMQKDIILLHPADILMQKVNILPPLAKVLMQRDMVRIVLHGQLLKETVIMLKDLKLLPIREDLENMVLMQKVVVQARLLMPRMQKVYMVTQPAQQRIVKVKEHRVVLCLTIHRERPMFYYELLQHLQLQIVQEQ